MFSMVFLCEIILGGMCADVVTESAQCIQISTLQAGEDWPVI